MPAIPPEVDADDPHDPHDPHDEAPCAYLRTTPDGLITAVNQRLLTLTGYERAELVGQRRFPDLLTMGGRIYHETHFAPMLQMQGSVREIALELVCTGGHRLPVLVNSVLERDPSGRPTVVRTAIFAANQRREYERELLRAKERAEEAEARARALASTLKRSFVPPSHPRIPGLELATGYRPLDDGAQIGGDFYDVFEVDPDDWCIVVGDVCGKGVEAAVVSALARPTLRAAAVRQQQPSDALRVLNEVLLHHDTERFCTVLVVRLRRRSGNWLVSLSCGGCPRPLAIRRGAAPVAVGLPGSLVGAFDDPNFADGTVELEPGDALVAYTDGVTEARSPQGEFFGAERATAALARHAGPAPALADGLLDEVMRFESGRVHDDIALVAVSVPEPVATAGTMPSSTVPSSTVPSSTVPSSTTAPGT